MADWNKIQNQIDGGIINAVSAGNSQQGLWYWREGVRRAMQDFRETGSPGVLNLVAAGTGGDQSLVATSLTARLFGVVAENTSAATPMFLQISDLDSGSTTLGTTAPVMSILIPAASLKTFVFNPPLPANATNGGLTYAVTTTISGATQTGAANVLVGFVYTT